MSISIIIRIIIRIIITTNDRHQMWWHDDIDIYRYRYIDISFGAGNDIMIPWGRVWIHDDDAPWFSYHSKHMRSCFNTHVVVFHIHVYLGVISSTDFRRRSIVLWKRIVWLFELNIVTSILYFEIVCLEKLSGGRAGEDDDDEDTTSSCDRNERTVH